MKRRQIRRTAVVLALAALASVESARAQQTADPSCDPDNGGFADGFAGQQVDPRNADHRPCGLAQGPDGALYVSDDRGGRIWRIVYVGE